MTVHPRSRTAPTEAHPPLSGVLCELPMFRPVAVRMLKVLSQEEPNFVEVVRILESDPGFAAEILTAANSALYAHSQVHTLIRAMQVLGTDLIKALTMSVAMRAFLKQFPQTEEMRKCWRHSRASALLGEEIASAFAVQKDRAYIAALMHDVGRFGLLAGSSSTYAKLLALGYDSPLELLSAERERLGFDHAQAGSLLITTWRLPSELAGVAGTHHHECGEEAEIGMPRLVRTACRLATAFGFESVRYGRQADPEEIAAELPGRRRSAENLFETLQERFNALALE